MTETGTGATIVVHRRVAWHETDAAGHNHFAAAFRWMEEAEHDLFRILGVDPAAMDRIPRVHIEIDYRARLYYGQEIVVTVSVLRLGRSSATLSFAVDDEDGARAIDGTYVIVNAGSTTTGAAPWPDEARALLDSGRVVTVRPEAILT